MDASADRLQELVFDQHACERWTHVRENMRVSSLQGELGEVTQWLWLWRAGRPQDGSVQWLISYAPRRVLGGHRARHRTGGSACCCCERAFSLFPWWRDNGRRWGEEEEERERKGEELFVFILFKRRRKTRKTHQSKIYFSVGQLLWWKYCTQVQFWGTYTVHFYIEMLKCFKRCSNQRNLVNSR